VWYWVGVVWHGACGLGQDVLCGIQEMVGAVHVGQCEGRQGGGLVCVFVYTHLHTPDL